MFIIIYNFFVFISVYFLLHFPLHNHRCAYFSPTQQWKHAISLQCVTNCSNMKISKATKDFNGISLVADQLDNGRLDGGKYSLCVLLFSVLILAATTDCFFVFCLLLFVLAFVIKLFINKQWSKSFKNTEVFVEPKLRLLTFGCVIIINYCCNYSYLQIYCWYSNYVYMKQLDKMHSTHITKANRT